MSFTSDYMNFRQNAYKKKKKKTTGDEFTDEFINALDDEHYQQYEDLAPVKKQTQTTAKTEAPVKEEKERSWFQKSDSDSLLDTIGGTVQDVRENLLSGLLGIGESVVDAGAYVAGGVGKLFGADEFAEDTKKFISKDLYDEKEVAKKIISGTTLDHMEYDTDKDSVLGEKTEGLLESGGQLLGTVGLQAVGVPWFVTTGVTSFGSEAENAFNQGATYGEAGLSAAISAGAEILTEKLFGGSGLGEKGLINLEPLTKGIANKAVKALADYGIDMGAEGLEEVASQFIGTLGQQLTHEKEATWQELLTNEGAMDAYIAQVGDSLFGKDAREAYKEAFVGGAALSGVANVGKVGSSVKNKTDYRTGLPNEQIVENEVTDEPIVEEQVEPQTPDVEENIFQNEMEKLENNITEETTGNASIEDLQKEYNAVYQQFREANRANDKEAVSRLSQRLSDLNQQISKAETDKTIAEEAAVEEEVAEEKQTSSPKDLMDIAKQARRENFHGAYTENGKQYLSDGSFVAEFNTVDESLEQRADFPGKIATQEIAEAFERPAQGNFDIHETEDGYVKVGNSVFDSKYVNAMVRAFDNPKFSIAKHRGGHDVLLVTGDNGRAVLMPVEAGENVNVAYEAQELAPTAENTYPEDFAPAVEGTAKKNTPNTVLYNKRDGVNGWGETYGTAQEALNDAVRNLNQELWNAFEDDFTRDSKHYPVVNAFIAVQEDVRQQTITPMQGAQLLSEIYNTSGADGLDRIYYHRTGNLYDAVLEKAKKYDTTPPADSTYPEDFAPITEDEANKLSEENLASLTDEDAPDEAPAPYYESENIDPFEDREMKEVSKDRKVNAYQYDNPEVKPFFQEEANILLGELQRTQKPETIYNGDLKYSMTYEAAQDIPDIYRTPRMTTESIEYLRDTVGMSYADIEKGLNAIIKDEGAENIAAAKKIEFHINDRLIHGYNADGVQIPPNQDYVNLLEAKHNEEKGAQVTAQGEEAAEYLTDDIAPYEVIEAEYNEAHKRAMEIANQKVLPYEKHLYKWQDDFREASAREDYWLNKLMEREGEDVAPAKETPKPKEAYEAIRPEKPKAEPRMKRADTPATVEDFNKLASKVYNSLKGKPTNKYHNVGKYGVYIGRNSADQAVITIKKPSGENVRYNIEGGKYWKNERLWHEAAEKVAKLEYPNVEAPIKDEKIAKVLTEEPTVDKKKSSALSMFKNNVLDKGMVFEDLSLETGNRELQARWNSIRYAENKAQRHMEKALKPIIETVEQSGKTQQFYEYLYHLHNGDRMSLESNAKKKIESLQDKFGKLKFEQIQAIAAKEITDKTTAKTAQTIRDAREYLKANDARNKPVFGDSVTAEVSQGKAADLEKANPEFKSYAKEVYDYMNTLRENLVDAGVISKELANQWAEIYPHYVPIRRAGKDGAAITVPLDTNRTGVNAPIKRATGGNSDILPLFDTMALRTEQTFKAIAKNRFGVELKNTLGTTISDEVANVDEAIDSIDTQDELLKEGKNGASPTFTVFEDGKRVEFEITEEMYDAMKPASKGLSYTNKVANTVGNVFRGLLTEYNPVFLATNAVKDVQDVLINSQHAAKTYAAIPKAITQMATKGHYYQEYLDNGGERNSYFDSETKTFKAEDNGVKKLLGMPLKTISMLNNTIERVPRLAEYIASREAGASVDVAMLDAARVTTNFAAGGDLTKMLNRNGFNFLNASTQGAVQQVRNIREAKANGLKGWVQLAAKVSLAGLPAMLLNNLLWDDDEEYEELSDYVKDNYYVVAKYGDGQFVRIPKGRTLAVIQDAFEQVGNMLTGDDEVDLHNFLELAITNLAPNNPLENNILAPLVQAHTNKAWYGDDIVPTRLQDLPSAEQFDESTDALSKWLGEKTNLSPYRLNYLLNQYSGGIGDVVLPMLTPETDGGGLLAPWQDKFTTDSVMNNQNVSDFYDTMDKLTANAKSSKATDEDVLKYKYFNVINSELSELYQQKREIQNSYLPDAEKKDRARELQEQIVSLTRDSLNTYENVNIEDGYASIGDVHFRQNDEGEWQKISDEQLEKQEEVTSGLGISAEEYWGNKEEYDYAYKNPEKYKVAKAVGGYSAYKTYQSELYDINADKDENGKSINGSRKEKVIDYVNNLDADYGTKIILFKSEYKADDTYNYDIIDYLNNREDISYEEMVTILKELDFTVHSDGRVTWD